MENQEIIERIIGATQDATDAYTGITSLSILTVILTEVLSNYDITEKKPQAPVCEVTIDEIYQVA